MLPRVAVLGVHEKLLCNRCAIVDIDVHHGNGTEEIVRRCNDPSKLFCKFYPGTGDEDDLALNIINGGPFVHCGRIPGLPMQLQLKPRPTARDHIL